MLLHLIRLEKVWCGCMNRKLITYFDAIIIAIIIVICIAMMFVFLASDKGNNVVISVNGEIIEEYSLSNNTTRQIITDYGQNTIVISNGECFVEKADCRDGICINRGKISKIGESIVCLPHKLIVEIK